MILDKILSQTKPNAALFLATLKALFEMECFEKASDSFADFMGKVFGNVISKVKKKLPLKAAKLSIGALNSTLLQLSALLLANLAAFVMNFSSNPKKLKNCTEDAEKFTKQPTDEKAEELKEQEEKSNQIEFEDIVVDYSDCKNNNNDDDDDDVNNFEP